MTEPNENANVAKRAGIVACGTLLSRILGAARDAVVAAYFSIATTDAFFVAFTIPNTLRALLGEGAVSAAFVPVYSEVLEREGRDRAKDFYRSLSGAMMAVLLVVTLLGVLCAPWLVTAYAAGYADEPGKLGLTIQLTRWVFPYIFFMGVAALGMGALHAHHQFSVPALSPALLNVVMIVAPWVFVPVALLCDMPAITALAMAAVLGGFLQMAAQALALAKFSLLSLPRWNLRDPYVQKVFRLLTPLLFGIGIYQANVLLSRLFASYLPSGSQSYLYYGQRIVEIPQGMFAMAVASASLPTLAKLRVQKNVQASQQALTFSLRLTLMIALPATGLLVLLAEPTAAVFFGRGAFDAHHIAQTGLSLAWQAAGVWAIALVRTLVAGFHAQNDTRSPIFASLGNLVSFVALSWVLMRTHGHVGLAMAMSGASIMQFGVLFAFMRAKHGLCDERALFRAMVQVLCACLPMLLVTWLLMQHVAWEKGATALNLSWYMLMLALAGITFWSTAIAMRIKEIAEVTQWLGQKLRR